MTIGTLTSYISIRKRTTLVVTVWRLKFLWIDVSILLEFLHNLDSPVDVLRIICGSVIIKVNVELWERIEIELVILCVEFFWCHSSSFSSCQYGSSMRVRPTDKGDIHSHLLQESNKDVGRNIGPEVTDVHLPTSIG